MNTVREIVVQEQARIAALPYERAIVEKAKLPDGRTVLHVWPVDGTEIIWLDDRHVPCWNGLSEAQQRTLIDGNYGDPIQHGDGWCTKSGTVLIETVHDETPGPRFYCLVCAIDRLTLILKAEGRQHFMQMRADG